MRGNNNTENRKVGIVKSENKKDSSIFLRKKKENWKIDQRKLEGKEQLRKAGKLNEYYTNEN